MRSVSVERAEINFVKDDISLVPFTLRALVDTAETAGEQIGTVTDT